MNVNVTSECINLNTVAVFIILMQARMILAFILLIIFTINLVSQMNLISFLEVIEANKLVTMGDRSGVVESFEDAGDVVVVEDSSVFIWS